jgi:pimeloyl-ACP methyl ester carboxylesterase
MKDEHGSMKNIHHFNTFFLVLCLIAAVAKPGFAELLEVAPQVKIYYEMSGEGPPLLFIPGWTMTSGIWKEQVAAFSKNHRVVVMDPRCHGNSSKALSGNSLQQHARDVRRLIEGLQLGGVTIVGWSMAVAVLLEYVHQFGNDQLKALVLVDGSPSMVKKDDWPYGLTAEETYQLLMQFENQRMAKTNEFVDGMFRTERSDPELEWLVKEALRTPTTVSTLLGYDYFSTDRRPLLDKISVPTLIVVAPENQGIGEFMKSKIARSELTVFEGLGHAMFLEDPKKFNERLAEFLKSLHAD